MEEQNLDKQLNYILAAIGNIQSRLDKLEKNRAIASIITAGMNDRDREYIDNKLKSMTENN